MAKRHSSREATQKVGYDFLMAELELGFTFYHLAANTTDSTRRERNRRNAHTALDTVTRLVSGLVWNHEMNRNIAIKADHLKLLLAAL